MRIDHVPSTATAWTPSGEPSSRSTSAPSGARPVTVSVLSMTVDPSVGARISSRGAAVCAAAGAWAEHPATANATAIASATERSTNRMKSLDVAAYSTTRLVASGAAPSFNRSMSAATHCCGAINLPVPVLENKSNRPAPAGAIVSRSAFNPIPLLPGTVFQLGTVVLAPPAGCSRDSVLLAPDAVAVSIEVELVVSDDLDRTVHVIRPVARSARAVVVADSLSKTGTAVGRVAL